LLTLKTNHDASGFYDVKGTWWAIYLKKYKTFSKFSKFGGSLWWYWDVLKSDYQIIMSVTLVSVFSAVVNDGLDSS